MARAGVRICGGAGRRAPGYGRQESDLIAVMQDGIPLREFLVYCNVKGPAQQIRDAAFKKVAHGGLLRQGDGCPLEAGRLTQAGEQDEPDIHGALFPL